MVERAVILLFVTVAVLGLWQLWRYYQSRKLTQLASVDLPDALAGRLQPGPTVLYFTGAHCAQCRLQQTPILRQLVDAVKINLHTVDAVQEDTIARFYGVMTLPTTVLLDHRHTPKVINHGLASLAQLRQQVSEILH